MKTNNAMIGLQNCIRSKVLLLHLLGHVNDPETDNRIAGLQTFSSIVALLRVSDLGPNCRLRSSATIFLQVLNAQQFFYSTRSAIRWAFFMIVTVSKLQAAAAQLLFVEENSMFTDLPKSTSLIPSICAAIKNSELNRFSLEILGSNTAVQGPRQS